MWQQMFNKCISNSVEYVESNLDNCLGFENLMTKLSIVFVLHLFLNWIAVKLRTTILHEVKYYFLYERVAVLKCCNVLHPQPLHDHGESCQLCLAELLCLFFVCTFLKQVIRSDTTRR